MRSIDPKPSDARPSDPTFDIVIVGGGPAGLAAALNLGRARKRVLLCDAGPRRNAAAVHVHGFVTRDGITPADFRAIGRQQLEPYTSVEARDAGVAEIRAGRTDGQQGGGVGAGRFEVRLDTGETVAARRVLLCTGMIDELPAIDGFRALWGGSIFTCPYCHGWEVQDRAFGFLALNAEMFEFALLLRGWSRDVVVLTDGRFAVPAEVQARFAAAGVRVEERRIARLVGREGDGRLDRIEFEAGDPLRRDVLFARPPQRQVAVVQSLVQSFGLALDPHGYVRLDDHRQTSIPGIYAGGDLVSGMQSATLAAASGAQAAAMLNHELTAELATSGALTSA